ncbi:ABC transporter permease [Clostridium oceanicum]|uniref:ABC transporter permease n=1 Tax=Clostridium oceanicum TaxID=1543 RepID=A0ABP3UTI6_9CLOT
MSLIENLKMALDSIRSNKLRSFLTMLGIIIGISSVITIVSLGQGGKENISGQFEKIGASTVNIKVDITKASSTDYITLKDSEYIKEKVDKIKYVSPMVQKQGIATEGSKNKDLVVSGGNTDLKYINNQEILYGRFFNDREYIEGKAVGVIDKNSAESLFGTDDAVGRYMKISFKGSSKKVRIIGVTEGFSAPFMAGDKMPVFLSTPITFLNQLFSDDFNITSLSMIAGSKDEAEDAGNIAKNILENRHHNKGQDVYTAESVLKQLDQINNVLGIFTTFISAVAAISLLVGGIGVMNIMLVSVTERTREIGIRKALGATTKDIMFQFLTESVIISIIGGIIGMILGVVFAKVIGLVVDIEPSISIVAIITAILFSSAVGIFFGIYPAKKAAQLNPIDALRYE